MAAFLQEYTMLDELGKGGFATVYKVRHNELGYVRAIRVLNETITDSNSPTYQNFLQECKTLLRLGNGNHPNIVHIYQPRLLANKALVEMDYIDGTDLQHYLTQNQNFVSTEEVIRLAKQMSSALAYCHEDIYEYCMDRDEDDLQDDPNDGSKVLIDDKTREGLINKYKVIHNDIHSGNIMRRKNGDFVLLDFGLAINGAEVVRSSRHTNGAPEFKAPEKWDDDSILTEQSDIYSFGIVLYQYLAGRVPFPYDTNLSAYRAEYLLGEAHQHSIPPVIEELRKEAFEKKFEGDTYKRDYPQWLEDAILKCLEKEPEKRFKNGKELHQFILSHEHETSINETEKVHTEVVLYDPPMASIRKEKTIILPPAKPKKKHHIAGWILLFALLIIAGYTAYNYLNNSSSKDYVEHAFGMEMQMVWVEGNEDIDGFYISAYEVTQAQWESVMGTTVSDQQKKVKKSKMIDIGGEYPMSYVSWDESMEFCRRLSKKTGKHYTLPSEEQWEYAANGGKHQEDLRYAGSNTIEDVAWYQGNSSCAHIGGQKQPNALGLYDMSGNMYEWCRDLYRTNHNSDATNYDCRVARGGSWIGCAEFCMVDSCSYQDPGCRGSAMGFRVVCLLEETPDKEDKYIDLGLPSGTLWKEKNEKGFYTYDQAKIKFGNRVPSKEQFEELIDKCDWTWKDNGYKVTGPNGASIFLPAEGYYDSDKETRVEVDYWGNYWSSTIDDEYPFGLGFNEYWNGVYWWVKESPSSVRLVRK